MVTAVNSRDKYLQASSVRTSKDFLSMEEKPSLITDYSVILNTQTNLGAQATAYGITTEKTAYDTAITTLTTFLGTLTTPVAWNDVSNITFVARATLTTNITAVYTAEKNLRTIINTKQSVTGALTVPNISMSADSSNVVSAGILAASGGTFKVKAGTQDITTGNGIVYSVVGVPVSCSVSINSTTGVYVPTDITADNASAVFRATLPAAYGNMIIDLPFNLSKVKAGFNGKSFSLTTDSLTFKIDKAGTVTPSSINITAVGNNLAVGSTAVFTITSGTATLTGTGDTRNLAYINMATNSVTISVTKDGLTDVVTLVKLNDGIDTINGQLTNEAHDLTANSSGVVTDYTGAVCSLNIFRGISNDNANWTFTKADSTGITSTITGNTVTITNITAGTASGYVDITATRSGFASIVKRFTISKSLQGTSGNSSFLATVYYQGATAPSGAITGGSYNFATNTLTVPTGGGAGVTWSTTQPATTTTPTYSTQFTFTGAPTATVTGGTWSTPVVEAVSGTSGEYRDVIELYGTTNTPPATNVYYNFLTNTVSSSSVSQVPVTNWSMTMPAVAVGSPVYMITQVAATTTPSTQVILFPGSWTTPVIVAQAGSDGKSTFTATVYYQGATAPSGAITGGSYNFATGVITPPTGGGVTWVATQPASTTTPTYSTSFTFAGLSTATVTGGTWSTPIVEAVNGQQGIQGPSGEYRDIIELYGTTSTAPTANVYYNFNTNSVSSSNVSQVAVPNWSMTMPTVVSGTPVYMTTQLATTTTPASNVTLVPASWTTPVVAAQVGSDGKSTITATAYYQSPIPNSSGITGGTYTNSTQTLSVVPTGGGVTWVAAQPTVSATRPITYISTYKFFGTSTAGVTGGTWSTPTIDTIYGSPEMGGEFRTTVKLYGTTTTRPSATTYYNFDTRTISSSNVSQVAVTNWSLTRPAATVGNPVYMITQTARTTTSSVNVPMLPDSAWSSPVIVNELFGDGTYTSVVPVYYQTTAPSAAAITGGSYNFATNTLTPPTGAGVTWVATQPATTVSPTFATDFTFSGLSTATVSGGTWSTVRVEAVNGASGSSGEFRDNIQLYGTTTTRPTSTIYYTFSSNTISASSTSQVTVSNWSLTPPAPTEGNPVYVISQQARTTTPFTPVELLPNTAWSAPVVYAQVGTQGSSYVTAYAVSTVSSTSTTIPNSTGLTISNYQTAVPATGTGGLGAGVVWTKTIPTLNSGEYMYQTDGIFNASTGIITWSIPYWSSLKVGSLAAITTNTGNLTVTGNIDSGTGATSWHVDSSGNMWSGAASFAAAPFSVSNTGVGKFNGSIQVGSAAISGTTTTGSGAQFNSSGTFALGTSTSNITYNGTSLYLNGEISIPNGLSMRSTANVYVSMGGAGFALFGSNADVNGIALQGQVSAAGGAAGVKGYSSNNASYGVYGDSPGGTGVLGTTNGGKAISGYSTFSTGYSGYFNGGKLGLTSGTTIELNGSIGSKGQVLQSAGSGAAPTWGLSHDGGAITTDASGNATVLVRNMQSSSFGFSAISISGCIVCVTSAPVLVGSLSGTSGDYNINIQTQSSTTGGPVGNAGVRWTAIG